MGHPGQVVFEACLAHEGEEVAVGTEEDVEAAFEPVAVGVLPGGNFATSDFALFEECYVVALFAEVPGGGKTCEARARDDDAGAIGGGARGGGCCGVVEK